MPPRGFWGPMTETLTPRAAADLLTDAAGFERSLARRTHGLTLMTWGLASSGMFVSYGFADLLDASWGVFATLWLPWTILGILTTAALWRSAALSAPRGVEWHDRREWTRVLVVGVAITIVFWAVRPDGPVLPLGLLGATYLVFGAFNVFRAYPPERRDTFIAGALMLGAAAALAIARAPIEVSGLVAIVTPAAVLWTLGFRETLTG